MRSQLKCWWITTNGVELAYQFGITRKHRHVESSSDRVPPDAQEKDWESRGQKEILQWHRDTHDLQPGCLLPSALPPRKQVLGYWGGCESSNPLNLWPSWEWWKQNLSKNMNSRCLCHETGKWIELWEGKVKIKLIWV